MYREDFARKQRSVDMPRTVLSLNAQNAIIRISLFGPPTAGTWGFTWVLPTGTVNIANTALDWDFTAAEIEAVLESDALIDDGDLVVSGDSNGGILITAQTDGQFSYQPLNLPTLNLAALAGTIIGGHVSHDRIGRP